VFEDVRAWELLLEGLERILMQTRMDLEAQAAASQLLLNLTAPFVLPGLAAAPCPGTSTSHDRTGESTGDEIIIDSSNQIAVLTQLSNRLNPTRHSENTGVSSSRHLTVRSVPTEGLTKDTLDGTLGEEVFMSEQSLESARALLNVALRVLRDAPYLDRESRENCIEVVLALLQHPPTSALNMQVLLCSGSLFGWGLAFTGCRKSRDGAA
jgi:hypothetical protein